MGKSQIIKSRERVKKFGEVFTPPEIVEQMMALLPLDATRAYTTVLEPSCGEGVFLDFALRRKLQALPSWNIPSRHGYGYFVLICMCSLYGIDIQPDNVRVCRARLLRTLVEYMSASGCATQLIQAIAKRAYRILDLNIIVGDFLSPDTITIRVWTWNLSPIDDGLGHFTSQEQSLIYHTHKAVR